MEKVSIKLSICNDYNIVLPPWYPPLSNQKERNKQSNGKWKLVMKRLIDFPLTFPINPKRCGLFGVVEVEIAASGGRQSGQGPDEKKSIKNLEIGNF